MVRGCLTLFLRHVWQFGILELFMLLHASFIFLSDKSKFLMIGVSRLSNPIVLSVVDNWSFSLEL